MRTTSEAPIAEPQSVKRAADAADAGGVPARAGDAAGAEGASASRWAVEVSGVCHSFGALEVIERLDIRVRPGEVLGVVGPSGCGKSTLLELVSGLREPTDGGIAVRGVETSTARLEGCAYMPQRDLLLPWLSAIDNAALALRNRGASRAAARR